MARREIPEELWALVRQDWEAGMSGARCAKKHGVSRGAIQARIANEGWQTDPLLREAVAITAAATLKAKDGKRASSRAALQQAAAAAGKSAGADPADNPVERIAKDRVDLIEEHQGKWDSIDAIYEDAMRILRGEPTRVLVKPQTIYAEDGITVLEKAEVMTLTKRVNLAAKLVALYEGASRGLMTKQEGERRAYGFDYKTQLEDTGVDEGARRQRLEMATEVITTVQQLKDQLAAATAGAPPQTPPTIDGEVTA